MSLLTRRLMFTWIGCALAATASASDALISLGANWRYLDDGSNQGSGWTAPSFDDSTWAQGDAQLGYGDGDEATVVSFGPDSDSKFPTTYFRHSFNVADPSLYQSLTLRLQRDDGVVVYLNGVEVARDNMPGGAIGFQTLAAGTISGDFEDQFYTYHLDTSQLVGGTNVLAAEVHQRSLTSSDLSFDLDLTGETTVFVARGPYLQLGTPNSIEVRWRTNAPATSRVRWGSAPGGLANSASDLVLKTEHSLSITGLAPQTPYFYSVGTDTDVLAGDDSEHRFETAPPVGTETALRIWALGDSGTANAAVQGVRDAYHTFNGSQHTDLWLMLGDNAYEDGTQAEYQNAVFDTFADTLKQSVLWPTRGNHDTKTNTYLNNFTLPAAGEAGGVASGTERYYSFDWANVHFVCLDSESSGLGMNSAMNNWLELDLMATNQDWIIAFWHHPPYSKGSHDSDTETKLIQMRQNFVPLLESYGVDLVLCGHSHSYERSSLIDGHYGLASTFGPGMQVDAGDGSLNGDGAYSKLDGPNGGAIYTVMGCSGKLSDGPVDHPAMVVNILDTRGSLVIDIDGDRLDLRFLTDSGQVADWFTMFTEPFSGSYCQAKPNLFGCAMAIDSSGTPSLTDTNPFDITATSVFEQKNGLLFYGFGTASLPFLGGTLCVQPPLVRTTIQPSGGNFPCEGTFTFDFNDEIQNGPPFFSSGTAVYAQYWQRDPLDPFGIGLTNALKFTVEP